MNRRRISGAALHGLDLTQALNRATILSRRGKLDRAIKLLRGATRQCPHSPDAFNLLGALLALAGRPEEALANLNTAVALQPRHASAYSNRGNILAELGRLAEAQRDYARAVELAPRTATFHRNLAYAKRFVADDPQLAGLEELARDRMALDPREQIALDFALGKAFADLDDPERSFRHLLNANALRRQQITYDEAGTLASLEHMRRAFTPELIAASHGLGHPSALPVFIVGMPRSGTTLTEQILASHPKVFGAGELDHLPQAAARLWRPPLLPHAGLERNQLRKVAVDYLGGIGSAAPNAERIVDKMPSNFRFVGLIHLALPNARIIHVRRDPVDTCLSCFSIQFASDQPFAYDLEELGRYYRAYERLMEHWRSILPETALLEVRYEDLVADLARQARRIIAHCGLEWDENCVAFHQTARSVRTASAMQVRQPIYRSSVGRSRRYARFLAPLLIALTDQTVGTAPADPGG
jgi:Flp pilus assembly protein TadD